MFDKDTIFNSNTINCLNEIKYIVIWQVICAFSIILYGTFRCKNRWFKDPLMARVSDNKSIEGYTDGWAISHVVFYMILGYLYPDRWMYMFVSGIGWEIIESRFENKPFYLSSCKGREHEKWWYGRYEDIISNTVGMMIGISLRKYKIKEQLLMIIN